MAKGYVTSALTAYVEENKTMLLKKVVLQGDTASLVRKQLGVKTKERIHLFDYEATLQNGSTCGFSADGSTKITEREIVTALFKVNDEWCDKDLLGKYAEYLVRIGANDNALPFEADIMEGVVKSIGKQMEKMIWQGDTASTAVTYLIDGFLTQAEKADSASTITASTTSAQNIYDAIIAGYKKVPEEILDKAVAFISPANFRELKLYLVNNYKYNASLMDPGVTDVFIPGTDLKVHKTIGLTGVEKKVYIADPNNMFLGADMLSDMEDIRLWFSNDDDVWRLKVEFNTGVKTAFPDEVVVVTMA